VARAAENGRPSATLAAPKPPALPKVEEVAVPRPRYRPPTAVLQILDDSRRSGEMLRLRTESCVIGRTEGDVRIVHDLQISTRHAEITRVLHDGRYSWRLRDLGSTNGTYVRVKAALLADGQEIIVGQRRFRFADAVPEDDGAAQAEQPPPETDIRKTCSWQLAETSLLPLKQHERPQLVELLTDGEGRHFPLLNDSEWMGRDSSLGSLSFPDDMTMNHRHAQVRRDSKDRWRIEDFNSANGVWLRVNEMSLTSQSSFMLGEQVFVIVFP
jgi:hypothetical protein